MNKIYLFFFLALLNSCTARLHYIGKTTKPGGKEIDIYLSESSVKKQYEITGQGFLNAWAAHKTPEKIQRLAEEKARQKGADAIIINKYYVPNTGQLISSTYVTDTVGRAVVTAGSTSISPTSTSGFNILFIRYTR